MDNGNLAFEMGDNGGSRIHRDGHVDDGPDTGGLCGLRRCQALLRLIGTEGRNKKRLVLESREDYRRLGQCLGVMSELPDVSAAGLTLLLATGAIAQNIAGSADDGPKPTAALVHGGFTDASGWDGVIAQPAGSVLRRLSVVCVR